MSRLPKSPKAKAKAKPLTQVAALCVGKDSGQVLVITSRDTGRWVLPKGWPMRKRSLPAAALREAWEEAGVEGVAGRKELGRYIYDKRRSHGFALPVEVRVFPVLVHALAGQYPEAGQRRREWVTPAQAAARVDEAGLQALLLSLPAALDGGLLESLK